MHPRRVTSGFTLLEVMVAVAILAVSLVVLLEITTNNVRATNHAKLLTAATFLARGKMVEIEQRVLEEGFGDADLDDAGTFEDEGFGQYRWSYLIERVELPANLQQKAQEDAQKQVTSAQAVDTADPMAAMAGLLGGMATSFIEPVRIGLQESVRRVTLTVAWDEVGRPERTLEVVTFMTDPSKLDLALGLAAGAPPPGGTTGTPAPGTPATGRPSVATPTTGARTPPLGGGR